MFFDLFIKDFIFILTNASPWVWVFAEPWLMLLLCEFFELFCFQVSVTSNLPVVGICIVSTCKVTCFLCFNVIVYGPIYPFTPEAFQMTYRSFEVANENH
jgi:hypothetical protein